MGSTYSFSFYFSSSLLLIIFLLKFFKSSLYFTALIGLYSFLYNYWTDFPLCYLINFIFSLPIFVWILQNILHSQSSILSSYIYWSSYARINPAFIAHLTWNFFLQDSKSQSMHDPIGGSCLQIEHTSLNLSKFNYPCKYLS
jgi:hypothetical protein